MCVKLALCDYQRNKNFCEFLYKVNRIFNTANKRSLWSKLVCFLDEHDQDYANNQYHSALSQKLDRSRSNLANCSCSRTSLKSPKYSKNTLVFSDREPKRNRKISNIFYKIQFFNLLIYCFSKKQKFVQMGKFNYLIKKVLLFKLKYFTFEFGNIICYLVQGI